jgi:molybdenum cofactor cytidylyltransferase
MLISSIITAAGRNSRMEKSQIKEEIPIKNKLLLPFPSYDSEKTVIETTIHNTLSSNVAECIVVLGHFADEIKEVLANISDQRLKIIENENAAAGLSYSLLNGLNFCKNDYVLCLAGDQPTVSSTTCNNLINSIFNLKNPKKSVSILRRKDFGILDSAEGLGMPFVIYKNEFIRYLQGENDNLNPILRRIFKDEFCFYGVKESNDLELININDFEDYKYVLKNYNKV